VYVHGVLCACLCVLFVMWPRHWFLSVLWICMAWFTASTIF